MRYRTALLATACTLVGVLPATALGHARGHRSSHAASWYLALGDSLARGAQPNNAGTTVPTNQGYANDLYAKEKAKIKGLKLEQLGCLGESTVTMMKGGLCKYAGGSQLAAAVKFIKSHKVVLVTLDIGANDVDSCAKGLSVDLNCVSAGVASIGKNVPKITAALRGAGRRIKMAGMTYYDPFLADWLQGSTGQSLAGVSVSLAQSVNGTLTKAFKAEGFKIADVAGAFDTYTPFSQTVAFSGSTTYTTVPLAVAKICQLTWMCAAAPKGPNIHADPLGYVAIANAFEAVL